MTEPLFPSLADPDGREAIRVGNASLSYAQLAGAATATADQLHGARRVAIWAEPTLELVIGAIGALAAGVAVVPINPGLGPRELGHIIDDSAPDTLVAWAGVDPPAQLQHLPRTDVDRDNTTAGDEGLPDGLDPEDAAFVMY
ncbi:MAG: AMP-binding protein, partial [Solirubrobacteraceae bacterium]